MQYTTKLRKKGLACMYFLPSPAPAPSPAQSGGGGGGDEAGVGAARVRSSTRTHIDHIIYEFNKAFALLQTEC